LTLPVSIGQDICLNERQADLLRLLLEDVQVSSSPALVVEFH